MSCAEKEAESKVAASPIATETEVAASPVTAEIKEQKVQKSAAN